VAERTRIGVTVEAACRRDQCAEFAWQIHRQLRHDYRWPAAVLPLEPHHDWLTSHRTARKRAAHAERLGYRFAEIDRTEHEDAVHAINTSAPARQGRPMSAGYLTPHRFSANPMLCERHHVYTYGVLADELLVAYLWLYRVGELAMVSSILGHADRLRDDIMYLLFRGAHEQQSLLGGHVFYNMWDGGTDGLRYFKARLGFRPMEVEWSL
jgi:hypothetical protein